MRKPLLFFFLAWSGKRTCLTVPSTTKEESERCNNVSGGTRTRLLAERGGKFFHFFFPLFFHFFIFHFDLFFSFVCVPEETDGQPRPLCFYLFALRTKRSGGDKYRISFGTIIIFKPETDKFEEGNKYCKSV